MSRISLEGQVAIVTGSGAGLGRSYALDLARRGAAVVVNDFARERADEVVAEIEAEGGRAAASYDSVADKEGGKAIVQRAVDNFGTLDVLVNNAGNMRNGWFEDLTTEDLQGVLAVHVGGCWHVTQAAWPILREKGYGRIVMVSSAGGLWAMQGISNYSAAKGGVYGLGRALAIEGKPHGILVNILLPGAATTLAVGSPVPDYAKNFRTELSDAIAPRRSAEAVAPLVSYLASSACTVTGETYSAVAGRFARVVVAVTDGWFVDDYESVTAEDVAEHFDEISDPSKYHVPFSLYDEYEAIGPMLGVPPAAGR
jgi:NAD(P)-dependent dehydrogenase (short-subunit alcohol dehydrogenase family)